MRWQIILLGIVIVIGALSAGLNLWVYLLEADARNLVYVGIGLLAIIGGWLNIRRILKADKKED